MGELQEIIRQYLGTDLLTQLNDRMEAFMATTKDRLDALSTKLDALMADVRAAMETLRNEDNLSPESTQALDSLDAKLAAYDTEIGDADGSDTPSAPVTPDNPDTPDAPVDPNQQQF